MFIINSLIELFTLSMIVTILFDRIKIKNIIALIIVAGWLPFGDTTPIVAIVITLFLYTIIIMILHKDSFYRALRKTIVSYVILFLVEGILYITTSFLHIEEPVLKTVMLMVSCSLALIAIYFFKKHFKTGIGSVFDMKWNLIILIDILWGILLILYISYYEDFQSKVMTRLIIGLLVFILFNLILVKAMYKLEKEKESLQIQNRYNASLEACMISLRAAEHEYKNHLNTICTTLQFGTTEELRAVINGYVGDIKDEDSLTKLMYVDNVILRAIIYTKIEEAEIVNVKMKYNVKSNLKDKCISDPDMAVILTNLLNNAIEAAKESNDKIVELKIEQEFLKNKIKYIFTVKNTVKDLTNIDLSSMFKVGFSSKGEDRGYGLSNMQRIVKENGGEIIIEFVDDMMVFEIHV